MFIFWLIMNILDLSTELFAYICSYLEPHEICDISEVCKWCNNIIKNNKRYIMSFRPTLTIKTDYFNNIRRKRYNVLYTYNYGRLQFIKLSRLFKCICIYVNNNHVYKVDYSKHNLCPPTVDIIITKLNDNTYKVAMLYRSSIAYFLDRLRIIHVRSGNIVYFAEFIGAVEDTPDIYLVCNIPFTKNSGLYISYSKNISEERVYRPISGNLSEYNHIYFVPILSYNSITKYFTNPVVDILG